MKDVSLPFLHCPHSHKLALLYERTYTSRKNLYAQNDGYRIKSTMKNEEKNGFSDRSLRRLSKR
jgi:hypothetical protein